MKIETETPANTILLHCHICKNGGSTIDNILRKNFGARTLSYEGPYTHNFLLTKTILEIAARVKDEEIASISSQHLGLPPPKHVSIKFIPLIMVREPLDRLGSMYAFYRNSKINYNHDSLLAKRECLKNFTAILLESGIDSSFSNFQCQFFLANYWPPKYPSEKNWETVVNNLEETKCVGLVEMFDESMVIWEEYLRNLFQTIDLSYEKQNVSSDRHSTLEERIDAISSELGTDIINEFTRRNQYDYRLYELTKKMIYDKINSDAEFNEKLYKYKIKLNRYHINSTKKSVSSVQFDQKKTSNLINIIHDGRKYTLSKLDKESEYYESSDHVEILGCGLFNKTTGENLTIVQHGQEIEVIIAIKIGKLVEKPIVGITVENDKKETVLAMNTLYSTASPLKTKKCCCMSVGFGFKIPPLNSGTYTITPAFANGVQEDHRILCSKQEAIIFIIPKIIEQRMPGFLYINDFTTTSTCLQQDDE